MLAIPYFAVAKLLPKPDIPPTYQWFLKAQKCCDIAKNGDDG